ncbi:hypothetical protein STEG23_023336 [Scotinomys teguina]
MYKSARNLQPGLALSLFATSQRSICLAAGPTHPTPAASIDKTFSRYAPEASLQFPPLKEINQAIDKSWAGRDRPYAAGGKKFPSSSMRKHDITRFGEPSLLLRFTMARELQHVDLNFCKLDEDETEVSLDAKREAAAAAGNGNIGEGSLQTN